MLFSLPRLIRKIFTKHFYDSIGHQKPTFSTIKLTEHYSSLYISTKYSKELFSVIQPSFDSQYLKYLLKNLNATEKLFETRRIKHDFCFETLKTYLEQFLQYYEQLESLKNKRNKFRTKLRRKNKNENEILEKLEVIKQEMSKLRSKFYSLEEKVVPFLLAIPNEIRQDIDDKFEMIDHFDGTPSDASQNAHDYIRLGYINSIHQSSIIGPNAKFFYGQGALMYYALIDMISDRLEASKFRFINGLDLVKSALIEAVNKKPFSTDPFMLRVSSNQNEENQRFHLAGEGSLESLGAFLASKNFKKLQNINKFYQIGSSYQNNNGSLEQHHNIRATSFIESSKSDLEMKQIYQFWWNFLNELGVQCRSYRCDIDSLDVSEYAKYSLKIWLHSRCEWIPVGNVSHLGNYVSQRLGLANYAETQMITSSIDLGLLLYTIFEHFQCYETGKVNVPPVLKKFML